MPRAPKNTLVAYAIVAWALIIVVVCLYTGLRKRKLVEPMPDLDVGDQYRLKVLLFDNIRECVLTAESGFIITPLPGGQPVQFPLHEHLTVRMDAGKLTISENTFDQSVSIKPIRQPATKIEGDMYRGEFVISANDDGESIDVINSLPIDSYLAGVVGAEMPSYWEHQALMAQAIACRTYSLYIKDRFGANRNWDVRRTQAHQVYRGVQAETRTIWNAVKETQGLVLTCMHQSGKQDIFPAYFGSVCGGHTENSSNVFGDSYPPLKGVTCPYCRKTARKSQYSWKTVEYDIATVNDRLMDRYPSLARLKSIKDVQSRASSTYEDFTRLTEVDLIGSNGKSQSLEAENFRLALDRTGKKLKSTAFEIVRNRDVLKFDRGRGFGHGVGMCQYGVQGMAREGSDYRKILAHYYPESTIEKLF